MPYLSASAMVNEEALYQVCVYLPFTSTTTTTTRFNLGTVYDSEMKSAVTADSQIYERVVRSGDVVVAERMSHVLVDATTLSTKYRMLFVQQVRRETYSQPPAASVNTRMITDDQGRI